MTDDASVVEPGIATRFTHWSGRIGLGRRLAVALAILALGAGLATYAALSGSLPFGTDARTILILLNVDLVLFLMLFAVVARRLVAVWMERRRGSVGSRLHSRLVFWFSLVALTPAIIVSVFSAVFFSFGMQAWFSDSVRTAVAESQLVADAYLREHQRSIRGDILAMARDLSRAAPRLFGSSAQFSRLLAAQGMIRNLSEAYVFDGTGRLRAQWKLSFVLDSEPVPHAALERARDGEMVLLTSPSDDRLRAVVKLDSFVDTFLYVGRYVEPRVLGYIDRTRKAVTQYEGIERRRSSIEITFAMVFILVALLLLMAAIWAGLSFATRLARPVAALAGAAERVRAGDLSARVPEDGVADEIGSLSRAFNRMTGQLETQRSELVEANRQLDARRHFMETVLSGVSAGVIGVDAAGRINLPNRSASELLSTDLEDRIGERLGDIVPEMATLLDETRRLPQRMAESQVSVQRDGLARTFLVRIVADRSGAITNGFVVTFDDITALLSAQRKAAWSDVARRIAHEIKNPLTPIQLSAERLRRKYLKEIESDPDTFSDCTDTIVRHVEDIGRMVDEFSSFARMPAPVMAPHDLKKVCVQAVALQRTAHPEIEFLEEFPTEPLDATCDGRQIGQALTNLLQNAVDAIEGRKPGATAGLPPGRIVIGVAREGGRATVTVSDNGRGLPDDERDRLTEPYVTTREKGTGLGLAIVRKIMEDHGGGVELGDCDDGGARVRLIFGEPAGGVAAAGATQSPGASATEMAEDGV